MITRDELIEKFLKGELTPEQYVAIYNRIVSEESQKAMEIDPPGSPHEHI